jgi:hypothetical protein
MQTIPLLLIVLISIFSFMFFLSLKPGKTFKDIADITQTNFTIAAIVCGAWWTYILFIEGQVIAPLVKMDVSHLAITDHENLLRVGIKLTNTGNTRVILKNGYIYIQQVKPLPKCGPIEPCIFKEINDQIKDALKTKEQKEDRFSWHVIRRRNFNPQTPIYIEPGETDYTDFEFVIDSEVKAIRVYSYFKNESNEDGLGWAKRVCSYFKNEFNEESENGWGKSEIYDIKLGKKI